MVAEVSKGANTESVLQAYLLGSLDFDAALRLQRRLHFEVTGDRRQAALVVCEHPHLITIGRQGSRAHLHLEPEELRTRRWPVRWVNRGGGCLLHMPGQFAVYSIMPLDRLGCNVTDYLQRLGGAIGDMLGDFSVHSAVRVDQHGVWAGERLLAALGVSVRDWVTMYGAYVNIHPALDLFRCVTAVAGSSQLMTSLERERRGAVRPALVRERLIEHVRARFGFERITLFTEHPMLEPARVMPNQGAVAGERS